MEQQLQSKVNFYELLGIDRQATHSEVKRAYRSLAKQYHPDVSNKPYTAKSFQLIQKAYEVLSDPQKREIYDKLLYRKEHGIGHENPHQYFRTRARYNAYYQTATEKAPETPSEQIQFHLKQFVGLVIVTALFLVGMGLMSLGVLFLFIKEFNGSMIAGYATLAGGTAILMNSLKAYRDIGNIWLKWFQEKE